MSASGAPSLSELLQLDEGEAVFLRFVLLRGLPGLRGLRGGLRRSLLLGRRGRSGLRAARGRLIGLVQRAVVDARGGAGDGLAAGLRGRAGRGGGAAVLGDGQHAVAVDADRDVLAIDQEPLQHRVLARGLEALDHLRERLLARAVRGEVRRLAGARQRQDALDDVRVQELRAELDELVGRQSAQPGAQLLRHQRRGVEVRPGLRVLAHGENPAGNRQPMATAPRKSAPSSAASVKSAPTSVAPANEAPWRFAARSETSTSRAPEKSAFSREAPPRRESRNTTRTRSAWSNRARYSLVSSKRVTASCAPLKTAFIASEPCTFARRTETSLASTSFRSQKYSSTRSMRAPRSRALRSAVCANVASRMRVPARLDCERSVFSTTTLSQSLPLA